MMWTEKYKPKKVGDVVDQERAKKSLLYFLSNFKKQRKKAVLLHGPYGVGKTSLVYAIANQFNYEIIELNASHFRDKKKLQSILGEAIKQKSLFAKQKLILFDELEGITKDDRGCLEELLKLIEKTTQPIILVTSNIEDDRLRKLKRKCLLIELEKLSDESIVKLLKEICRKEKIKADEKVLEEIARSCDGDARAAINDLQFLAAGRKEINKEALKALSKREKERTVEDAIKQILEERDALGILQNVNANIDEIFLWLDENLGYFYRGYELEKAYEMLSKADIFKARITRQQHWRFLFYVSFFLTQGVALAKKEKKKVVEIRKPLKALKIWMIKQKQAKRIELAEKIASLMHCSKKIAYKELFFMRFLKF